MSDAYRIRRLSGGDSLEELTALVHRAFERLARMGLHCQSATQDAATTAQRVARGECFVALYHGRIVGTLVLELPDPASPCPRYRLPGVASVHQFAVEPAHQGRGCGQALLAMAERRARELGCRELALDTPTRAAHLLRYYEARGFRIVERMRHPGRDYASAVLARTIGSERPRRCSDDLGGGLPWFSPHRLAAAQAWTLKRAA